MNFSEKFHALDSLLLLCYQLMLSVCWFQVRFLSCFYHFQETNCFTYRDCPGYAFSHTDTISYKNTLLERAFIKLKIHLGLFKNKKHFIRVPALYVQYFTSFPFKQSCWSRFSCGLHLLFSLMLFQDPSLRPDFMCVYQEFKEAF